MPVISDGLSNLIGGVSQQPPAMRLRNSAEKLQNAYPSVVSGLKKRSPTLFIQKIMSSAVDAVSSHIFNRIGVGTSIVVATDGDLKVYSEDGTEQTVTFTDGKTYLNTSDPQTNIGYLTIADTTFVYNTSVPVATLAVPEDGSRINPEERGSVQIKQAVGNKHYNIYINNNLEASFLTSNSSVEGTEAIATSLVQDLTNAGSGTKAWTAESVGSTVSITLDTTDKLVATDGYGDQGTNAFKEFIDDFTSLPPNDVEGRVVKVLGDVEEAGDDYFVVYKDGFWVETLGYNAGEQLDPATMPHALFDNGDGTWEFRQHEWKSRSSGSADSNHSPSIVSSGINDMFIYKGRMSLLAGENIVMSEVREYENFYRTTLTQLLDSDRIDIASTNNRVSEMFYGIPFNETVLLFSDKAQFKLTDKDVLSPATVSLVVASSFNASTKCKPVSLGQNVVFVDDFPENTYAGLREYFVSDDASTEDSAEITIQVPEYIPSGVFKLTSSTSENTLVALTSGASNKAFVYNYYWGNDGKVQSAWSEWIFSDDTVLLDAQFIDNFLYFIVKKTDGVFIERADFQESVSADLEGLGVLLDRRAAQSAVTVSGNTVTLPYELVGDETVELVTTDGGSLSGGIVLNPEIISGDTVTFSQDLTGVNFYIGIPYTFLYELSPFFIRDTKDTVVQDGQLKIKHVSIIHRDTAYFEVVFTTEAGQKYVDVFSGRNFGSLNNILGSVTTDSGEFRSAISGRNDRIKIEIINNKPFPSNFSSIEWAGQIFTRTKRL